MSKSCESIVNRMNTNGKKTIGKSAFYEQWDQHQDEADEDRGVNDDDEGGEQIIEKRLQGSLHIVGYFSTFRSLVFLRFTVSIFAVKF